MRRKAGIGLTGFFILFVLGLGIAAVFVLSYDEPELHDDIQEHFKYGSIGSESRAGVPDKIWYVLPKVFADRLPPGDGEGWARFGFLYEPGKLRPIGTSRREKPLGMVGLNCAVCHVGTLRESTTAPAQIILGMPANQFDLRAYVEFLRGVGRDDRFNPDTLIQAIKEDGYELSWWEERVYRYLVIPRTKDALEDLEEEFGWVDRRPAWGPGRVDTFNPYKSLLDIDLTRDDTIGTSDLPTIWNQRPRDGMYLHWDGNNDSLSERNKSAAIGAGATPSSLDLDAMERIEDWILDFPPPPFPAERIDRARVETGARLYARECAACHNFDGARVGQVVPVAEIGTDGERVASFSEKLVEEMNKIGEGRPWGFNSFRKTDGYVNMPLDGVWLRAPYLHNGSVPTLRALLYPEERPAIFYRGFDVYDYGNVGFVSSGPEAEANGFRFDTSVRGNSNAGHLYGTRLPPAEKDAIIEYLKTR